MSNFEVPEAILNSAFAEPTRYWYLRPDAEPVTRDGRRPSIVYPPEDQRRPWALGDVLAPSADFAPGYEMTLVNRIRDRVAAWRAVGYPGATATTLELLRHWSGEGRRHRLFFAQREAAETVIFLTEGAANDRTGLVVPTDEPTEQQRAEGAKPFVRLACKMATGSGKTTVMAMLAAWSILNKVQSRGDARFSDVVLVVCPNVTIKSRLGELNPADGDASLYRTRDLVPARLMERMRQGKVLVTNWHAFALRDPNGLDGVSARVRKVGREVRTTETIRIGERSTTARGTRYLTVDDYQNQRNLGLIEVRDATRDATGNLTSVEVVTTRYVESDTAWSQRVLGHEIGGKQNLLVFNDEAHHAYRIRRIEADDDEEPEEIEDDEYDRDEATVWMDGLDRINRLRGINACVDLSATPYFLGRVGQDTNKPFPWTVSDFALTDAIESGLVKIPQLAVRDPSGAEIPGYRNVWRWILPKLTPGERGSNKASPKPDAILKYAYMPIAMLGGLWEQERERWAAEGRDARSPVFILVCKNTRIAKVVYEWLAEGKQAAGIAPSGLAGFRNREGETNTIRVDTKVIHESDAGGKADEVRWMRLTLDTVGRPAWPTDGQGRPIYPEGYEDLAAKLGRPLYPPGRDVRCIVSVGMLTEGWDCNTVTHIVGLRPFQSQLLCEQVVGRGLRRRSYDPDETTGLMSEEVAKVFGVPFEAIPFKANPTGPTPPKPDRVHVHAVPAKAKFRIEFPRVERYAQMVRNRVTLDWDDPAAVPTLVIDPVNIPPEVEMKGQSYLSTGRPSLSGPGKLESVTLNPYRQGRRMQELVFELAGSLTRSYASSGRCAVPPHVLFPQLCRIVGQYVERRVEAVPPTTQKVDAFCSPYYGWIVERLTQAIRPDAAAGEAAELPVYEENRGPGSTDEVSFWTSREVRPVNRCHLNYAVSDTAVWEQSAAYYIATHPAVEAWAKNAGLGFEVSYLDNGATHVYEPDFIIRLAGGVHLILETKGRPDPKEGVKAAAARRWVDAVNADGRHGRWAYSIVREPQRVRTILDRHGSGDARPTG